MSGAVISDRYSLDDIERALDRLAEEITVNTNGQVLIPVYQWLEQQLETRMRSDSTMAAVRARVAKKRGKG